MVWNSARLFERLYVRRSICDALGGVDPNRNFAHDARQVVEARAHVVALIDYIIAGAHSSP